MSRTRTDSAPQDGIRSRAERFAHGADIGVRGIGATREAAFEQAARALTSAVTKITRVRLIDEVAIRCEAADDRILLADWLNALIYEMAVNRRLFGRFQVSLDGHQLSGRAWGERVDPSRHVPAVEPKGATYTAIDVGRRPDGSWIAQCVIDV